MDKNRKNKVLITKCVNEIMYIDYLTAVKITFQKKKVNITSRTVFLIKTMSELNLFFMWRPVGMQVPTG